MQVKMFEVRDRATMVVMVGVLMSRPEGPKETYLVKRSGYAVGESRDLNMVLFLRADGDSPQAPYDPHAWHSRGRTYRVAHLYIQDHWDDLQSGDVVDVEFILGETTSPEVSEAGSYPV